MTPPGATSLSFQRESKKRQAEATASLAAAWTGYVSDVFAWTLSVFYMFGFRDVIGKTTTLGAGISNLGAGVQAVELGGREL